MYVQGLMCLNTAAGTNAYALYCACSRMYTWTTFFLVAATPTDCLLDNSRVVSIAMSFGFTVFVLVYVAAAFSGKLLSYYFVTHSLGCGAVCDSSDFLV